MSAKPREKQEMTKCLGENAKKKALQKVPGGTSTDPGGILIELVKMLGQQSMIKLRETVDKIFNDQIVPGDGRLSRMNLIDKGKRQKSDIGSYRPVTVTSVI